MIALLSFIPGGGPIIAAIIKGVQYILGCLPCMIVIGLVAAFVWGDIHGHRKANAACKAADLAMQLRAVQLDASIKADAATFAQQQAAKLAAQNTDLNKKVTDYESAIAKAGAAPGCKLTGDDVRRLRDIGKP